MGLTLTNHTTSLMVIPLFGVYLYVTERKMLLDIKRLTAGFAFFVLGLTPLLYLPIASSKNPAIDWGNPETLTNFIRVISRHQYQDQTRQTFQTFASQFSVFCSDLLTKQWFPAILLFAIVGFWALFRYKRSYSWFFLVFLAFTMPITTYMTNFDVTTPAAAFENKALVSVFYIPAYMLIAILIGIGLFYLVSFMKTPSKVPFYLIAAALPIVLGGSAIAKNYTEVSMHDYFFARDYADNIFSTLPPNSLLMVDWDPFSFPMMYYQFVEHKRPDLVVLDQQLLKRTWFLHWLSMYHPDFVRAAKPEVDAFLAAVAPFENNSAYNGDFIQQRYLAMIDAFIDRTSGAGHGVYFTYMPEPGILRSYHLEPQFSAYRYTAAASLDTAVSDTSLKLDHYVRAGTTGDRMAKYLRGYYGNQFAMRGIQFLTIGDTIRATPCFEKALRFFDDNTQQAQFVEQKLSAIWASSPHRPQ
jgi:hypothetical protein